MNNKLLWFAGAILAAAFLFPNGIDLARPVDPVPAPAPAPVPAPTVETDAKIVELLAAAAPEDKSRIVDVYTAMAVILKRDDGKLVNTTEKWATFQTNTLTLAIDQPGKYPGLDVAIEAVFLRVVGTDDVLPNNGETQMKLIKACDIIVASAKK
jgi:hypothetical protein